MDVHPIKNGINRYWSIPIYIQVYHGSPIIFPICWIFSPPEIAAPEQGQQGQQGPAPPSRVPGGAQVFRSGAIEFHIEYII